LDAIIFAVATFAKDKNTLSLMTTVLLVEFTDKILENTFGPLFCIRLMSELGNAMFAIFAPTSASNLIMLLLRLSKVEYIAAFDPVLPV
jgi:hypothetical protein